MKSQSLVVQFLIFFVIGFSFFLSIGIFFRSQANLIKNDILDSGLELETKYISTAAGIATSTCKTCDNVSIRVELRPVIDYRPKIGLGDGIVLSIEPENKVSRSSINNLKHSLNFIPNEVSSVRPITLMYDRTKNNLVIQ